MECATCATPNAHGAKFCSGCGTSLNRTCPRCNAVNAPDANFCDQCGASAADAEVPAASSVTNQGERRLVTALFADLVDFTPFSESHDPEEVRAMLVRYFARAQEIVEGFDGMIDKYTGDAITAFWGARVAREDDAERAVRAGLALVDAVAALGQEIGLADLRLRVGVLTGEASVGPGGNEMGLVVGDIVNSAARLQAQAEPGTVFVGESTRALAKQSIAFEHAGAKELKGLSQPVDAYRAVTVVGGRAPGRHGPELEPPFVGRAHEMRLLEDLLHATAEQGMARLVSIIGDGGIGKSRLARELVDYSTTLEDEFSWHLGRSPAHAGGVAFSALREMVRQRAGLTDTDDEGRARDKLTATVAEYCPDEDEQRWILPRLSGLLGLDPLPAGDRDDLFGALRTFFQRVSERAGVLLVFEDLHWADEGLLEFIVDLVERSHHHPMLVVTLARPDLLERHPNWGAARQRFTSTHLGPLADSEMTALVTGMVPGIEDATVELVVSAAAGVPLYAVEYVRMLLDSGDLVPDADGFRQVGSVETLTLPDSLQAMAGARLDRLDPAERAMVQDAAVFGHSFTLGQLARATDRTPEELRALLDRLVRAGILEFDADPRSPEKVQCRFVQSTIREVAYRRLSKTERRDRHLAIVERFRAADVSEFAGVVASHYLSALEARPDPDLAERARGVLLEAARRATELHADQHALNLVTKALEVPGDEADRVPFWDLGAGAASAAREHDTAITWARRQLDWQIEHGDDNEITHARYRLGRVLLAADLPAQAVEALDDHFEPDRAATTEMAHLGLTLARAHAGSGNNKRAADVARDILVTAALLGDQELVVGLLRVRGFALNHLNRVYESLALLREAVRLATELDSPAVEAAAIGTLMVVDGINGRRRDIGPPTRLREIASKAASPAIERYARVWMGRIQTALGEFEEARDTYTSLDHGSSVVATYNRSRLLFLDWVIDGDVQHLQEATALLEPATGNGESPPQRAVRLSAVSQYAFAQGKPELAFDTTQDADYSVAVPHSFLFDIPLFSALRLRDVDRLRRAEANLPSKPGVRFASLGAVAAAGISLLEEGSEDAASRFVEAAEHHATVDGPGDAAHLKAILGGTLPHSEIGRAAGQQAHDWFARHGAKGYLDLYADVWRSLDITEMG